MLRGKAEIEGGLLELLEERLAGVGGVGRLERHPPAKRVVADDPEKIFVVNRAGAQTAFLMRSPAVAPGVVARAVRNAEMARRVLPAELAACVIEPLLEGTDGEGRSFVLWPYYAPLSERRFVFESQRLLVRGRVLRWLEGVTRATARPVDEAGLEDHFRAPLARAAADERLPAPMRRAADDTLARLARGTWRPHTALMHNDLHLGNVLLRVNTRQVLIEQRSFLVIDWGGAHLAGYPYVDLVAFAYSSRLSARALRRQIELHAEALGGDPLDARPYLLARTGYLGANLEEFPVEVYLHVCANLWTTVERALS